MNADVLTSVFAALLSLALAYIPGASGWYGALSGDYKRLVMAGGLLVIAVVVFALACGNLAGELGLAVTCDQAGVLGLVRAYVVALVVNQAAYSIAVRGRV